MEEGGDRALLKDGLNRSREWAGHAFQHQHLRTGHLCCARSITQRLRSGITAALLLFNQPAARAVGGILGAVVGVLSAGRIASTCARWSRGTFIDSITRVAAVIAPRSSINKRSICCLRAPSASAP